MKFICLLPLVFSAWSASASFRDDVSGHVYQCGPYKIEFMDGEKTAGYDEGGDLSYPRVKWSSSSVELLFPHAQDGPFIFESSDSHYSYNGESCREIY